MKLCTLVFSLFAFLTAVRTLAEGPRPQLSGPALVAPLFLDEQGLGTLWTFPAEDPEKFFIEAPLFSDWIKPLVKAEVFEGLLKLQKSEPKVFSIAALKKIGMSLTFDEKLLQLSLVIPSQLREKSSWSLFPLAISNTPKSPSADFSGFLNTHLSQAWEFSKSSASQGLSEFHSHLEGAMQWKGLVFESGAEYSQFPDSKSQWKRLDTKFVYDIEKQSNRITLGDLTVSPTGFQSAHSLGGLSFERQFGIQPTRNVRPVSRSTIELKTVSKVEVFVNGVFLQQSRLGPGIVELKDIPIVIGHNQISLRVTDSLGKVEELPLSILFDSQLLEVNMSEFHLSLGALAQSTVGGKNYNFTESVGSFYQRWGIEKYLTSGINFQVNSRSQMGGLEATWLTALGTYSFETALSHWKDLGYSEAVRLRWRSLSRWKSRIAPLNLRIGIEQKGKYFSAPSVLPPNLNHHTWLDTAFALPTRYGLYTSLSAQYAIARNGFQNEKVFGIDLSKNLGLGFQLGANYQWSPLTSNSHRALVHLTWIENAGLLRAGTSYESGAGESRVYLQRSEKQRSNDYRIQGDWAQNDQRNEASLDAQFLGHRGLVGLTHNSHWNKNLQDSHAIQATVATSVAWTDESVSWGRPITDSFAIIKKEGKQLKDVSLGINRQNGEPLAYADRWGPALLSDLASYSERSIIIDTSNLADGVKIPMEFYSVKPSRKSGTLIRVTAESKSSVRGKIIDLNKTPVGLVSGEVFSLTKVAVVGTFFTNRKGNFLIESLDSGEYELRPYELNIGKYRFKITDDQPSLIELPPFQMKSQRNVP